MASDVHMSKDADSGLAEELSAFHDGEIDRDKARFLIRRLINDREARARLERFALIGACLRGEGVTGARPSLADRVAAALDAEGHAARRGRLGRWWRWPAGLAVAAAVAGVALLAGSPVPTDAPAIGGMAAVQPSPSATPRSERVPFPVGPAPLPELRTVSWIAPERRVQRDWPLVAEPPAYLRLLRGEQASAQPGHGVATMRASRTLPAESSVESPPRR